MYSKAKYRNHLTLLTSALNREFIKAYQQLMFRFKNNRSATCWAKETDLYDCADFQRFVGFIMDAYEILWLRLQD